MLRDRLGGSAVGDRVRERFRDLPPVDGGGLSVVDVRQASDRPAVLAQVARLVREEGPLLAPREAERLVHDLTAELVGLGPLDALLADPAVTEVMVNGADRVWVERSGVLERIDVAFPVALVLRCIERILLPLGLRIDRTTPYVDARLADGSRVNAVIEPLAVDGACLTIRRFSARALPLEAFTDAGTAALLREAVIARQAIVVSGSTGSGKTTLCNALAACIPHGERVVTVEDTAELRLDHPHVVRLEARPPTAEGVGEVTLRDLVRNALRMRPDRILVGEVRGAEAFDMLQAMHTGHRGSMSTVHANSADDALRRLEVMVLLAGVALPLPAVWRQLTGAIDLLVHVEREADGRRRIVEVAEVAAGAEGPVAERVR